MGNLEMIPTFPLLLQKEQENKNTYRQNLLAPNCISPCERLQDQIPWTYQKGYFAFVDAKQSFLGDTAHVEAQTEPGQAKLCSMRQTQL